MDKATTLQIEGSRANTLSMDEFARFATSQLSYLAKGGVQDATLIDGAKVFIDHQAKKARYVRKGAEMLVTPTHIQITVINPNAALEDVAQALRQVEPPRTQTMAGTLVGTTQPRISELEASLKGPQKN